MTQKELKETVFFWMGLCVCVCCFHVSVVESCCFFILQAFEVFDGKTKPIKERERQRNGGERERESLKLMRFFYSGLRGNKCELLYLENLAYFLHGKMNHRHQWRVPSTECACITELFL